MSYINKKGKIMENDFFEKNKISLIQEIGTTVGESNNILNDIINNTKIKKGRSINTVDNKLLIALGHKLGYLSAVYNQLYTNIKGDTEKDPNKIGF
jgi:hypothetical protein